MAKRTMEKNSVFKFFEILKDNFFNIVLLGLIFSAVTMILTIGCFGLSALLYYLFGAQPIFNYLTFLPYILLMPFFNAILKIERNFVREVPVMLWSDLKQAFTQNFLQSLFLGIFDYVAVVLVCIAYNYYSLTAAADSESIFAQFGIAVCVVFGFLILFISSFASMMIVTLDLKFREILKNSLIFSYLCLPRNVLMTLSLALWLAVCFALGYVGLLSGFAVVQGIIMMAILLFLFAFIIYILAFFTYPPIEKHILNPYYEEHPEQTSAPLENSSEADSDIENSDFENSQLPEYVYHNGRMVHRSIFEREKLVDEKEE